MRVYVVIKVLYNAGGCRPNLNGMLKKKLMGGLSTAVLIPLRHALVFG